MRLMTELKQSLGVGFHRLRRRWWRCLEGCSSDGRHEARVEPRLAAEGGDVRLMILGKDVAWRWNRQGKVRKTVVRLVHHSTPILGGVDHPARLLRGCRRRKICPSMNERLKPEAGIGEETCRRLEHLPSTQAGVDRALMLPAANQDNFYELRLPFHGSPPKATGSQPLRLRLQARALPPYNIYMDCRGWFGQCSHRIVTLEAQRHVRCRCVYVQGERCWRPDALPVQNHRLLGSEKNPDNCSDECLRQSGV